MRLILIVLFLCVIVAGALFGALNGARVAIDFYLLKIDVPLGAALLCALFTGWLLGGLVAWFGHMPRMRKQARTIRDLHAERATPRDGSDRA